MLDAIAIIPSAPVLVPELAGAAVGETAGLRAAVLAAAAALPPRWITIVGGETDAVYGPDSAGTFAGYGADLPVRLSPRADAPVALPLGALVTGWVRGQVQPDVRAEVRVYGPSTDTPVDPARGARLRAEIDAAPDPVGVLVVADGANTLTPAAPGGYVPEDLAVQSALDDALAGGDAAALAALPSHVVGRAAFAVLAGLAGPGPRVADERYRGAPYGVGYFVGVWQP